MSPITAVGVVMGLLAGVAALALLRPADPGPVLRPAVTSWLLAMTVTVTIGIGFQLATTAFLLGAAVFTLPVLVLLTGAAIAAGADRFGRWLLPAVWGTLVFPAALLVPLALTSGCLASECGFEDFGAALPLVVAPAAFVLLGVRHGASSKIELDRGFRRRSLLAAAALWLTTAIWLAHLEGALDAFTPRILIAAAIGPVSGAIGWLLTDLVRDTRRPIAQSATCGWIAGLVAAFPGAATVTVPWSPIVGVLAGALAALVFSMAGAARLGPVTRSGLALLVAAFIGFLAPPVAGDTLGIVFAGRAAVLVTPVAVFVAVSLCAVAVSVPVWLLVRRRRRGDSELERVGAQ